MSKDGTRAPRSYSLLRRFDYAHYMPTSHMTHGMRTPEIIIRALNIGDGRGWVGGVASPRWQRRRHRDAGSVIMRRRAHQRGSAGQDAGACERADAVVEGWRERCVGRPSRWPVCSGAALTHRRSEHPLTRSSCAAAALKGENCPDHPVLRALQQLNLHAPVSR